MRASQKVMAACIFSGQCANYGCLPLYHYETILNVMELSFIYIYDFNLYSPFYPSLQLRLSLLFGYMYMCVATTSHYVLT